MGIGELADNKADVRDRIIRIAELLNQEVIEELTKGEESLKSLLPNRALPRSLMHLSQRVAAGSKGGAGSDEHFFLSLNVDTNNARLGVLAGGPDAVQAAIPGMPLRQELWKLAYYVHMALRSGHQSGDQESGRNSILRDWLVLHVAYSAAANAARLHRIATHCMGEDHAELYRRAVSFAEAAEFLESRTMGVARVENSLQEVKDE